MKRKHETRVAHGALLASTLWGALLGCDDEPQTAKLVEPVYVDPCRYFPADGCSNHGECHANERSEPICLCEVGYRDDRCGSCEPGFHLDARALCVSDRSCAEQPSNPCGAHGMCQDSDGVISCACEEGYWGPRCTLCADGYARTAAGVCQLRAGATPRDASVATDRDAGLLDAVVEEPDAMLTPEDASLPDATPDASPDATMPDASALDASAPDAEAGLPACSTVTLVTQAFESLETWPMQSNQCDGYRELVLPDVTLRSRPGSLAGLVYLCAPTSRGPLSLPTRFVELEATAERPAELRFREPVHNLRVEYAARQGPLALSVLADDVPVATLSAPANTRGVLALPALAGTSVLKLRSLTVYLQTIAIDDLSYREEACQ